MKPGTTSVTAIGARGDGFAHSFNANPEYDITWYNPDNPSDTLVPGTDRVNIDSSRALIPDNSVLTGTRTIEARAQLKMIMMKIIVLFL